MTPTIPLPAPTRSLSLGMYVKSWVNEVMLKSDGTTAGDVVAVPPPPPQAIATIPTTPSIGTSLANLIGPLSYLSVTCCLLPGRSGARVRRRTDLTQKPHGGTARRRRACLTSTRLSRVRSCGQHNLFKLLTNPSRRPSFPVRHGEERRGDPGMAARPKSRARRGGAARARPDQPGRHRAGDRPVAHNRAYARLRAQGFGPRTRGR